MQEESGSEDGAAVLVPKGISRLAERSAREVAALRGENDALMRVRTWMPQPLCLSGGSVACMRRCRATLLSPNSHIRMSSNVMSGAMVLRRRRSTIPNAISCMPIRM